MRDSTLLRFRQRGHSLMVPMSFRKAIRVHVYSPLKAVAARFEIDRYLSASSEPKLNVGAGKNILNGWLNVDLDPHVGAARMDAVRHWPFPDDTFCSSLCEHMIEHVPKPVAEHILSELWRTLRRGGMVRIVTPDFTTFARLAIDPSFADAAGYLRELEAFAGRKMSRCDAINEIFYGHGHQYIYTPDELSGLMRKAGFADLSFSRGGQHVHPVFAGTDGHDRIIGRRMNEIEAFAIEARKEG
jgi:hypothetical protein